MVRWSTGQPASHRVRSVNTAAQLAFLASQGSTASARNGASSTWPKWRAPSSMTKSVPGTTSTSALDHATGIGSSSACTRSRQRMPARGSWSVSVGWFLLAVRRSVFSCRRHAQVPDLMGCGRHARTRPLRLPECEASPVTTFPETHFRAEGSCQDGGGASMLGIGTSAVVRMVGHCEAVTRGLKE